MKIILPTGRSASKTNKIMDEVANQKACLYHLELWVLDYCNAIMKLNIFHSFMHHYNIFL